MTVATADARPADGQVQGRRSRARTRSSSGRPAGQLNPNPVVYDIIAHRPTDRPTAQFLRPDRPTIKVPSNVKVDLVMTGAGRPRRQGRHPPRRPRATRPLSSPRTCSKAGPRAASSRRPRRWTSPRCGVKPGTKRRYWLTVRDTREPTSNKFETPRQIIEVGAPRRPPREEADRGEAGEGPRAVRAAPAPGRDRQPQQPEPGRGSQAGPAAGRPGPEGQPRPGERRGDRRPASRARARKARTVTPAPTRAPGTQPGQENEARTSRTPTAPAAQNDPQLQKLRDDLQKKGLLNQSQNGNKPNPKDAGGNNANPQQGNPAENGQQPQTRTRRAIRATRRIATPRATRSSVPQMQNQPGGQQRRPAPPQNNPQQATEPELAGRAGPARRRTRTRPRTSPSSPGTVSSRPEASSRTARPAAPSAQGQQGPGCELAPGRTGPEGPGRQPAGERTSRTTPSSRGAAIRRTRRSRRRRRTQQGGKPGSNTEQGRQARERCHAEQSVPRMRRQQGNKPAGD